MELLDQSLYVTYYIYIVNKLSLKQYFKSHITLLILSPLYTQVIVISILLLYLYKLFLSTLIAKYLPVIIS